VGLRCRNPPRHLSQLKTKAIALIEAPSGKELCRPSLFDFFLWRGSLNIFHEKYIKDGKVLDQLGLMSTLPSLKCFSWDIYRNPPP
jgi:hypothetical protein